MSPTLPPTTPMEGADRTAVFEAERPRLLAVAYRMLGSRSEAEDVVQDAWVRWAGSDGVDCPKRWLHTVTSRLALDQLRSARRRREEYVGPWLPEPVDVESFRDPAELADSLSMALLAVLERLTPDERAAFLLRQVFDYPYADVASVVGKPEATCRQLVHRARKHLEQEKPRFQTPRARREELLRLFAAAATSGDLSPLVQWLDRDVVLTTDGGGRVPSALRPIVGAEKVARFFLGVWPKRPPGTEVFLRELNGEPALVAVAGGVAVQTLHFDFSVDGRLGSIFIVRNPEKLRHLSVDPPAGDPSAT
ncbi:MAG: RNA polymerase sigma-70 factor [Acidobacteriota bacterium]